MQRTWPILWDIYEEHLDEAAFLWTEWEQALDAANYTRSEVADGPEERLLAHLDALVLGGRAVAERLVVPALDESDPTLVTVAAWVLLQAEHADCFERVWQAVTTADDPERLRALSRALQLSPRADLPRRLRPAWSAATPEVRACIIEALAAQSPSDASRLALHETDIEAHPALLRAAMKAAQRAPHTAFTPLVERGLLSDDPETLESALQLGGLLRIPSVHGACLRRIGDGAPCRRMAMTMLALGADASDHARLVEWSRRSESAVDALWALGFSGRIDGAELLLMRLDEKKVAAVAAESFASITGLLLEGPLISLVSADAEAALDTEAPVPSVLPEHALPMPDAERVRRWWRGTQRKFDVNKRYIFGAAWNGTALEAALDRAPTWRLRGLRIGLGADAAARLDLRQWTARDRIPH